MWGVKTLNKYFQNMRSTWWAGTHSAAFLWQSWEHRTALTKISLDVPFLLSSKQHRSRDVWFVSLHSLVTREDLQWKQCWHEIYFQDLRDDVMTSGRAKKKQQVGSEVSLSSQHLLSLCLQNNRLSISGTRVCVCVIVILLVQEWQS